MEVLPVTSREVCSNSGGKVSCGYLYFVWLLLLGVALLHCMLNTAQHSSADFVAGYWTDTVLLTVTKNTVAPPKFATYRAPSATT